MLKRSIPSTGEEIPAIGLGTWIGFDIGGGEAERGSRAEVLRRLFDAGGTVIDSSPMYGRAERVTGDLLTEIGGHDGAFLATKIRTSGRRAGVRSIGQSLRLMRTETMDLMQIHNLVDWRTHLATLRAMKEEGRTRYIGITHYTRASIDDLVAIVRAEKLDFVQLGYSAAVPDAAEVLLPLCADKGVATMINRPFEGGDMLRRVHGADLPPWAAEFDIRSWGQFFLKFVLSHPAVTCVIPGTGNPDRAADDFAAGQGHIPDMAEARRMLEFWRSL